MVPKFRVFVAASTFPIVHALLLQIHALVGPAAIAAPAAMESATAKLAGLVLIVKRRCHQVRMMHFPAICCGTISPPH